MSLKENNNANERLLHRALDLGLRYFDTADLYEKGENERILGKAFKEKRKEVTIATKVGNQWRNDGSGWDWNPRKEYILSAVNDSLQRLQTDYIDLYQLHGGTIEDPIDETIEAFELLAAQGKILNYGISSIRPNVIRRWVEKSRMASVMMQYSLLDRRAEEEIFSLLQSNDIAVLARGSVAQGLLVNKAPKEYLGHAPDTVARVNEAVHQFSTLRTPAQTAALFSLHHPAVSTAVIGIRTEAQLIEAAAILKLPDLTKEEWMLLDKSAPPGKYTDHR